MLGKQPFASTVDRQPSQRMESVACTRLNRFSPQQGYYNSPPQELAPVKLYDYRASFHHSLPESLHNLQISGAARLHSDYGRGGGGGGGYSAPYERTNNNNPRGLQNSGYPPPDPGNVIGSAEEQQQQNTPVPSSGYVAYSLPPERYTQQGSLYHSSSSGPQKMAVSGATRQIRSSARALYQRPEYSSTSQMANFCHASSTGPINKPVPGKARLQVAEIKYTENLERNPYADLVDDDDDDDDDLPTLVEAPQLATARASFYHVTDKPSSSDVSGAEVLAALRPNNENASGVNRIKKDDYSKESNIAKPVVRDMTKERKRLSKAAKKPDGGNTAPVNKSTDHPVVQNSTPTDFRAENVPKARKLKKKKKALRGNQKGFSLCGWCGFNS